MRTHATILGSLSLLALASCGPPPPPALDRLRMDVGANGALYGLVSFKTSILDSDATYVGLAEQGITTPEGVGFVVTLEPQSKGSSGSRYSDVNGVITAVVNGGDTIGFAAPVGVTDNRVFVLTAKKPGTGSVDVSVSGYTGKITIPITVTAQP